MLFFIALAFIIALTGAYVTVYKVASSKLTKVERVTREKLVKAGKKIALSPTEFNLEFEEVRISAHKSVKLSAWWIPAHKLKTSQTVVLLHGMHMSKILFLSLAKELVMRGFNVLLPDLRGHGSSDGDFNTYGKLEVGDIICIFDWLEKTKNIHKAGLMGVSLGAIIGIQVAPIEKRISALVLQSPYSKLETMIRHNLNNTIPIFDKLFYDPIKTRMLNKLSVDPAKVDMVKPASIFTQPVLYIAGLNDKQVPSEDTRKIYDATRNSADVRLFEIPKAGHNNIHKIGGEDYWNQITGFFNKHIPNK